MRCVCGVRPQCLVTTAGAVSGEEYLDPRTAQVITVNHIKQRCVGIRPATEEENTPASLQGYRCAHPPTAVVLLRGYYARHLPPECGWHPWACAWAAVEQPSSWPKRASAREQPSS